MKELKDRVAVVTGAASGIGLGIARAFAGHGMRLVLADIESSALQQAVDDLTGSGAEVVAELVDVADAEAVERLADRAYGAFGKVHVICNNAGVIENNLPTWEYSIADWDWVFGVNLMGVVHGIRSFVPRMIAGGEAGHLVNTASLGGLITGTANPIYVASKHAVVALSESLQNDLAKRDADIGVSVLCPGWVRTNIVESDRNRDAAPPVTPDVAATRRRFQSGINSGIEPEAVGAMVVEAIAAGRFYIHTHPEWMDIVQARFDAIRDGQRPAQARIPNPKR